MSLKIEMNLRVVDSYTILHITMSGRLEEKHVNQVATLEQCVKKWFTYVKDVDTIDRVDRILWETQNPCRMLGMSNQIGDLRQCVSCLSAIVNMSDEDRKTFDHLLDFNHFAECDDYDQNHHTRLINQLRICVYRLCEYVVMTVEEKVVFETTLFGDDLVPDESHLTYEKLEKKYGELVYNKGFGDFTDCDGFVRLIAYANHDWACVVMISKMIQISEKTKQKQNKKYSCNYDAEFETFVLE
jgi:hypothetical protein